MSDKVVDLMAKLEASVAAAKEARDRKLAPWFCPVFGFTHEPADDADCRTRHVQVHDDATGRLLQDTFARARIAEKNCREATQRTFELSERVEEERSKNEPLIALLGEVMELCVPGLMQEPVSRLSGVWRRVQQARWGQPIDSEDKQ